MVQGISKGKPQVTITSSQQSLFGNGQEGSLSGQPRDPKAEEERAKAKFQKTQAGQTQAKAGVYGGANIDNAERAAAGNPQRSMPKITKPAAPKVAAAPYVQCHFKHPPYPVLEGFTVLGGSGISPHIKDCDVYCSLDHQGQSSMPWETGAVRFVWEIKNYGVPNDVVGFKRMVDYLEAQIKAGKKVHVGCMAGHGRTGMVLAALRMQMAGDKDAIMHVRNNYCDQAVETDAQIKWLMDHYGMNKAPPRVKKYAAKPAGAAGQSFVKGNWKDDFESANSGRVFEDDDDFESTASTEARAPHQTSWAANSPWLRELEGPSANLTPDQTWYEDGA